MSQATKKNITILTFIFLITFSILCSLISPPINAQDNSYYLCNRNGFPCNSSNFCLALKFLNNASLSGNKEIIIPQSHNLTDTITACSGTYNQTYSPHMIIFGDIDTGLWGTTNAGNITLDFNGSTLIGMGGGNIFQILISGGQKHNNITISNATGFNVSTFFQNQGGPGYGHNMTIKNILLECQSGGGGNLISGGGQGDNILLKNNKINQCSLGHGNNNFKAINNTVSNHSNFGSSCVDYCNITNNTFKNIGMVGNNLIVFGGDASEDSYNVFNNYSGVIISVQGLYGVNIHHNLFLNHYWVYDKGADGFYTSYTSIVFSSTTYDVMLYATQAISSQFITVNDTLTDVGSGVDGIKDYDLCLINASALGNVIIYLEDGAVTCAAVPGLIGGTSDKDVDKALTAAGATSDYINTIDEIGEGIAYLNGVTTLLYIDMPNLSVVNDSEIVSNPSNNIHNNLFVINNNNATLSFSNELIPYIVEAHNIWNNTFINTPPNNPPNSSHTLCVGGIGNFYSEWITPNISDCGNIVLPAMNITNISIDYNLQCLKTQDFSGLEDAVYYNFSILDPPTNVSTYWKTSNNCSVTIPSSEIFDGMIIEGVLFINDSFIYPSLVPGQRVRIIWAAGEYILALVFILIAVTWVLAYFGVRLEEKDVLPLRLLFWIVALFFLVVVAQFGLKINELLGMEGGVLDAFFLSSLFLGVVVVAFVVFFVFVPYFLLKFGNSNK